MSLTDFITKWNGKGCDYDGYYGDQCVDLMNQYVVEALGFTTQGLGGDTAYNIYVNANNPNFTKIPNTPTGVPSPGDIMFFKPNVSGETGSAGHVSVFISGDVNSFVSFDQNYPTGTLCHKQNHDYNAVAGWLHPKSPQSPTVPSTEGPAAVKFDGLLQYLKKVSIIQSDAREDNIKDDRVLLRVMAYHDNMEDIKKKYEALIAQPAVNPVVQKNKTLKAVEDSFK